MRGGTGMGRGERRIRLSLEALEERARTELGMIKEGELFYQVIEPEPEPTE